jgi:hypothetical protein
MISIFCFPYLRWTFTILFELRWYALWCVLWCLWCALWGNWPSACISQVIGQSQIPDLMYWLLRSQFVTLHSHFLDICAYSIPSYHVYLRPDLLQWQLLLWQLSHVYYFFFLLYEPWHLEVEHPFVANIYFIFNGLFTFWSSQRGSNPRSCACDVYYTIIKGNQVTLTVFNYS